MKKKQSYKQRMLTTPKYYTPPQISTPKKCVRATLHPMVLPPRCSASRTTTPTCGPAPSPPPRCHMEVRPPTPLAARAAWSSTAWLSAASPQWSLTLDLHHCSGDATRGRFLTRMLTQAAWHHGTKRSSAATGSRSSSAE
jgi:hypothetical protein